MQNVSNDFRDAIYAGAPTNVRLTFADGTLTKTLICGLSYDSAVNPDTDLTIGSTNCAGLVITCFNNDIGVDLNNKTFTAEIGVYAPSADADANGYEWCAMGTFISEKPASTTGERLEIVAYDKMRLFDHDATDFLAGLTFPITAKQLFTQLCAFIGVTASEADFINGSKSFTSLSNLGGTTCRDILGYVAELACSFARMSRQDVCELVWFNETQYELDRGKYFAREASEYSVKQIDKLQAKVTADDIGVICGSGENAYIIVDNPLLYGASDAAIRPYAEPIYNRLAAMASYVPCSVSAIGDPSIEAGDVITVGCYRYDALISADGKYILDADEKQFMVQHGSAYTGTIRLPIFGVSFDWNGGIRAEYTSTGTESREPLSATNRQHLRDGAAYAEMKLTVEEISTAVYDENGNSRIQQVADSISLVVDDDGDVTPASIVAAINGDESEIKLSADKLDLEGYVTISSLQEGGTTTIDGGQITTGIVAAERIDVENLNVKHLDSADGSFTGTLSVGENFSVDADGILTATQANISGNITANALAANVEIDTPTINGGTIHMLDGVLYFGADDGVTLIGGGGYLVLEAQKTFFASNIEVGNLTVSNSVNAVVKNCIHQTEHYGKRKFYCYETPQHYLGDIGHCDAPCRVDIDPIFAECVHTDTEYEVFLTPYGNGRVFVSERCIDHFTVRGDNIPFGWEIKAVRRGFEDLRLDLFEGGSRHDEIGTEKQPHRRPRGAGQADRNRRTCGAQHRGHGECAG